ncbi:MAG TPA: radical SAM family heme chaperone HemW [Actinomycetes bacterium]|nr:radical SAM family heme chaperone HemW [Actinomycetes bacterium]
MPSTPPEGEAAPVDGSLPDSAVTSLASTSFSAYVHVPFCVTRCGYCDFNTYTATELGGSSHESYVRAVLAEIALTGDVVPGAPPLSTVFFGGGTPTLLSADDQVRILRALIDRFGITDDCEVTSEANPESVTPTQLRALRAAGVNRISFGMQSAVPHVLATLDRTHTPGRVAEALEEARSEGFDNISLDLIYGTPGESIDDWKRTLDVALSLAPDHISAYALIVEPGTALSRRIDRGEIPPVDDDDQAEKYEIADAALSSEGLSWYELSNWSRSATTQCRHNLAYWRGANWWGFGPGAHSHVGGVRWWNVKHPRAYGERLAAHQSPALAREVLAAEQQAFERTLLEVRLRDGLRVETLDSSAERTASALVSEGMLDAKQWSTGRLVLTLRGRLLADLVVRRLTDASG